MLQATEKNHLAFTSRSARENLGMEVIIVSVTNPQQSSFWKTRLEATRGEICNQNAEILIVEENWEGGAGNALGTLYALKKAQALLFKKKGKDLFQMLQKGSATAIYHTAGKGTRLAPLPASEGNNKSAVKLPGLVRVGESFKPITILEAVIRQTSIFAPSRSGRLSVFWGDQLFIPSKKIEYRPSHHADIIGQKQPLPDATTWSERSLDAYGLLAISVKNDVQQVEKISHSTATALIHQGDLQTEGGIALSLGSFSLSCLLTKMLLEEFSPELAQRRGKLDTDPHFWMPMTLSEKTYQTMMLARGTKKEESESHWKRMQCFKGNLLKADPSMGVLGCVDIGLESMSWDFGTLTTYFKNVLALPQKTKQGQAMQRFFNTPEKDLDEKSALDIDDASLLINCHIKSGKIRKSVLVNVKTPKINVCDSVLIDIKSNEIEASDSLLYHIHNEKAVLASPKSVRSDVHASSEVYEMKTHLERDGKNDWEKILPSNKISYANLSAIKQ